MTQSKLSLDRARRIVIRSQLLSNSNPLAGKDGVAQTIEHLGYLQIDTIAVVKRAHHHTLWTRCPDYQPSLLHDLVTIDRRVFEYWAHAMAFLPMSDYRFYIPRMERHRTTSRAWLSEWKKEHGHVLDQVINRIRKEGALTSKDFELSPGKKRGTWWDWKPTKRALEILFWQGHLMISERKNFQKVYDLTERVLPPRTDTTSPTEEELGRFHVCRALGGLGVAQERGIRDAFHIANRSLIVKTLEEMRQSKEVIPLSVEGLDGTYYALTKTLEREDTPLSSRAHILSPFDNLTIQRNRMARLFGFKYTLECYLPEAKRKYGYFVLPILWRDELIGRLDSKADRKTNNFLVKNLWFEPGFQAFDEALPAFADALARFAKFNNCNAIELNAIVPTGHKRRLKTLVRRSLACLL
ncbi:MAG: crosslink repair DNA glycosylase YcaQ family protein [Candidatus Bipolaricaulota bacterium]